MGERDWIEIKELEGFCTGKGKLAKLIIIICKAMWDSGEITIRFKKEPRNIINGTVFWEVVKEE